VSGINVYIHECMGKLVAISVTSKGECCKCDPGKMLPGCCKTQSIGHKVDNEHAPSLLVNLLKNFSSKISFPPTFFQTILTESTTSISFEYNLPPPKSGKKVLILNQNFLI